MCENTNEPDWEKISGYKGADEGYGREVVELKPRHMHAISLLLQGKTQSEVAAEIGVTQRTISRWMQPGSVFKEVLLRRQHDLWKASKRKILALHMKGLEDLNILLDSDDEYIRLKSIELIFKNIEMPSFFDPDDPFYPNPALPYSREHYEQIKQSSPCYYKEPERFYLPGVKYFALEEKDYITNSTGKEWEEFNMWKFWKKDAEELSALLDAKGIPYKDNGSVLKILNGEGEDAMVFHYGYHLESEIFLIRPDKYSTEYKHKEAIIDFFEQCNGGRIVYGIADKWSAACIPKMDSFDLLLELAEEFQKPEDNQEENPDSD